VIPPFAAVLILASTDIWARENERRILIAGYTTPDTIGPRGATSEPPVLPAYPKPTVHPNLIVNLMGPFVRRKPKYSLGALVHGRTVKIGVRIGNHTRIPVQAPIEVRAYALGAVSVQPELQTVKALKTGDVATAEIELKSNGNGSGPGRLELEVTWGDRCQRLNVVVPAVLPRDAGFHSVSIRRYPGACRAAFAWRGDMDLYDTVTMQSISGLEAAFGLGARYRIAQTMYLSTRLSLDEAEAKAYQAHFGVDRGWGEVPALVDWFRENVDLRHACAYPFESDRRFVIELGNHGHLHYGTDAAAAAQNQWKVQAKMGAGAYPWVSEGADSFIEQRDNALEAARTMKRLFDYGPRSWAMPDRTRDENTPAAMEAAGCSVLSDSDVRTVDNVVFQPPPHHPPGTVAVELTKRYPGDPKHVYHLAMTIYWMHRAHRLGLPVIFMCHQHMLQHEGYACERFTEHILRHALSKFNGDLYIDTVFGIGEYYKQVLSPRTASVKAWIEGDTIRIKNEGATALASVPVDLEVVPRGEATYLVDLPPGSVVTLHTDGNLIVEEAFVAEGIAKDV